MIIYNNHILFYNLDTPTISAKTSVAISVMVKLGTATNIVFTINNGAEWRLASGVGYAQEFNINNGLNSSTYTNIIFKFLLPDNGCARLQVGGHSMPNTPAQVNGTIYTYGWKYIKSN
jgi:hypothetical protein